MFGLKATKKKQKNSEGGNEMTEFAIGQDSHAFARSYDPEKPLILGGVVFDDVFISVKANSDGDVILHALTNAISGITTRNILGKPADDMCKSGITDSAEYLKLALDDLEKSGYELTRISLSVECKKPKLSPRIEEIRQKIAALCGISPSSVGITATTGEGLSPFGKGLGIQVFCGISAEKQTAD